MSEEKSLSIKEVKELVSELNRQHTESMKELIQEMKKPTVLEQQALDKQKAELIAANEERKTNSQAVRMQMEDKRNFHLICTHKHRDGNSHGVLIWEKGGSNYIHCQLCHANIRPGARPENADPNGVYDTALFNRVFQELPTNEMMS